MERIPDLIVYTGVAGELFLQLTQERKYKDICEGLSWQSLIMRDVECPTVLLLGATTGDTERATVLKYLKQEPVLVYHDIQKWKTVCLRKDEKFEFGVRINQFVLQCDFANLQQAVNAMMHFQFIRPPFLVTLLGHTIGSSKDPLELLKFINSSLPSGSKLLIDFPIASESDPRVTNTWIPPFAENRWYLEMGRKYFQTEEGLEVYTEKEKLAHGYRLNTIITHNGRQAIGYSRIRLSKYGWARLVFEAGFNIQGTIYETINGAEVGGFLLTKR